MRFDVTEHQLDGQLAEDAARLDAYLSVESAGKIVALRAAGAGASRFTPTFVILARLGLALTRAQAVPLAA